MCVRVAVSTFFVRHTPVSERIRENAFLTQPTSPFAAVSHSFFLSTQPIYPWFLDPATSDARFMIPYLYWMLGIHPKWTTRIESIIVHLPYPFNPCHVQKPSCLLEAARMDDVVCHSRPNHPRYAILDQAMKKSNKLCSMRSSESTEVITDLMVSPDFVPYHDDVVVVRNRVKDFAKKLLHHHKHPSSNKVYAI